jgi:aminopeptidase
MDPRIKKLADSLVHYSCRIQKGEKVLVSYGGATSKPLVKQIIKEIYATGAFPYLEIKDTSVTREIMLHCEEGQLEFQRDCELMQMKGMDAFIAVRATDNISELSDVPAAKMTLYNKTLRPVLQYRVDKTKWVILRYPNESMAQLANTSLETFR